MTQLVRLINPDTVDHFAAELGHDMEQVINHPSFRAMMLNLQIHGRVHVHRHSFDSATRLRPQPFKERAHSGPATAFANPEYLLGVRINRHGGVPVTFKQGELIHNQSANSMPVRLGHFPLEPLMIDGLDCVPVQPQQGCYMLNWHQAHQGLNPVDHARGQAPSSWQPANPFKSGAAGHAANSADGHVQPDTILEQVAFSNPSDARVVDGMRVLVTTTAARQIVRGRSQSDEYGLGVNLSAGFHRESFPEQVKKISIHGDGGGSVDFLVLANSKLTGFTVVSYFFTLIRDEPFFADR